MNKQYIFDSLKMSTDFLIKKYEKFEWEPIAELNYQHFPNNIHWQLGHILTVFELSLSFVDKNKVDIEAYNKNFGNGTKPEDWDGKEIPSVNEIVELLGTIPERLDTLTDEDLETELPEPIVGQETVRGLLILNTMHIPLHTGKIEEMARIIRAEA
ncbi:DinB family protein [Staphylococcus massiliensis]|uniref:DinB-like domain-containing protein n=1 Tax=Staphylococcus massiliensis S46 TaxID=1229783 RepID=K9AE37_9STAP|nr:DinB family protein [Staphylococcus massiliensis]EKU45594.1 hypothetical protein C273_10971 [Staphylococcus massiliensis S46]MCG3399898.1 DinB family protein [Staphylococcus massiliensis]MCG3402617.1 DinB family protein [Staphylococcus massiliensis]MCG3413085.1 DinB family protein [Staphylococcus massiliensis]PNZ98354.1 DinB family protein [Staphylococcus massiliensis CCUG 55927]